MVWPIMGDACRQSLHLKDGVEASQRVRRSGRSAPSSTFAFNEQFVNCSGPEVLVLYRKREGARGLREHGVLARFRHNDLKEAARGCGGRGPYANSMVGRSSAELRRGCAAERDT